MTRQDLMAKRQLHSSQMVTELEKLKRHLEFSAFQLRAKKEFRPSRAKPKVDSNVNQRTVNGSQRSRYYGGAYTDKEAAREEG